MTTRLAALFVLASIAACGGSDNPLIGTWKLDVDATRRALGDDIPADSAATLSKMKLELTFTATEFKYTMQLMGRTESDLATYEITKRDGNRITFEATDQNGKRDSRTLTIDGDLLTMTDGDRAMVLRRR